MRSVVLDLDNLTLQEVKDHLVIDFDNDDTLIQSYIDTSLTYCENYCRTDLISKEWTESISELPNDTIPRTFIIDNTTSTSQDIELTYQDEDSNIVNITIQKRNQYNLNSSYYSYIDNYIIIYLESAIKVLANTGYSVAWSTGQQQNLVYEIPVVINQARKLIIGSWYRNREDDVIGNIKNVPNGSRIILDNYLKPQV